MKLRARIITSDSIPSFKVHTESVKEVKNCLYNGSPFQVYKQMSSKKKGARFESIVQEYCTKIGYKVEKPDNSDHDRKINGKKAEIKGSMLWSGKDEHFRWQQLRPAQDYDVVIFLALFPHQIEFYGCTKQDVKDHLEIQNEQGHWIHNQHGGLKVNSGTFFLDSDGHNIPTWFRSIDEVLS